jgi:hypothetical protein
MVCYRPIPKGQFNETLQPFARCSLRNREFGRRKRPVSFISESGKHCMDMKLMASNTSTSLLTAPKSILRQQES